MSVTLKQIAERTGLSPMTVSRVLRGIGKVKAATRQRVLEVAEELGHSRFTGVVLPHPIRSGGGEHGLRVLLPYGHDGTLTSELGQRLLHGLEARLQETGGMLFKTPFESVEEIIREARNHRVHGIVLRQTLPRRWLAQLKALHPVVYATADDFQTGVDSIFTNENRCAAQIIDHLFSFGHEDIAFFGIVDYHAPFRLGEDRFGTAVLGDRTINAIHGARYAAWTYLAQCQSGFRPLPVHIEPRDWRHQSLEETVRNALRHLLLLRPQPTAIVIAADSIATETIRAMKEQGLAVPEDISIVSYGAMREGREHIPPVTSSEPPLEQIGRTVPELVERRLAQRHAVTISLQLEARLREGGTVAAPRTPHLRG